MRVPARADLFPSDTDCDEAYRRATDRVTKFLRASSCVRGDGERLACSPPYVYTTERGERIVRASVPLQGASIDTTVAFVAGLARAGATIVQGRVSAQLNSIDLKIHPPGRDATRAVLLRVVAGLFFVGGIVGIAVARGSPLALLCAALAVILPARFVRHSFARVSLWTLSAVLTVSAALVAYSFVVDTSLLILLTDRSVLHITFTGIGAVAALARGSVALHHYFHERRQARRDHAVRPQ